MAATDFTSMFRGRGGKKMRNFKTRERGTGKTPISRWRVGLVPQVTSFCLLGATGSASAVLPDWRKSNEGNGRIATRGGAIAGIVGEKPGVAVESPHVDDARTLVAFQDRQFPRLAAAVVGQGDCILACILACGDCRPQMSTESWRCFQGCVG